MNQQIGIGLLGLGTVGTGVANIVNSPQGRNPLVSNIKIARVAVKDTKRIRLIKIDPSIITNDPFWVTIMVLCVLSEAPWVRIPLSSPLI